MSCKYRKFDAKAAPNFDFRSAKFRPPTAQKFSYGLNSKIKINSEFANHKPRPGTPKRTNLSFFI
ncbi:hypothetical protein CAMRE0001_1390 [Campylobacter rectus RM3267]|uniref:Uncharacterized protein n=1 Tax=Campylobacter rectus RM3267 TaxID=553218 RepID=B9D076_CAMRE|nr:hypothetical protein CAMRE0001_1390 [Campylobacter rectus RM3267]